MEFLQEAVSYYRRQGAPQDQTALVALLKELQAENGGQLSREQITQAAQLLETKESYLLAVIHRIPSLRLSDKPVLEICGGAVCPKRADLLTYVEKTWGREPEGFILRQTGCMRLCGQGPNIRWKGELYHRADPQLLDRLLPKPK